MGGLQKEPFKGQRTGRIIRWKPDNEVFTDIAVPAEALKDMLRRQAVVNDGVTLDFTDKKEKATPPARHGTSTCYEHGITDYGNELVGEEGPDPGVQLEARPRAATAPTSRTIRCA